MLQVFPRIYNPLKDWAMSDEAYVRKLQDEANDLLKRKVQVTEDMRKSMMRADDMKTKVSQGQDIHVLCATCCKIYYSLELTSIEGAIRSIRKSSQTW
jgi:hypothetical protein